jgi:fimbrial chaperone protein
MPPSPFNSDQSAARHWRRLALGSVAATLLIASFVARADLMLFPTRIVFDKNQRAAQVELINQGKVPETYRISVVNRRMSETGEITPADPPAPGEQFADEMLRYSPRQVTIAPGSSQTVRMLLRKPAELAPGEYRSHLQFDRVAEPSAGNSVDSAADAGGDKVGVVITALVGASIPVIVRQGETQATVTLAQLALEPRSADAPPSLAFQIVREGNRSVYGDLAVTFTPRGGTPLEVAKAGGVAVYVPNPMRRARMPLQLPAGVALTGGSLRLSYRERADSGGKLLAEQTLQVP